MFIKQVKISHPEHNPFIKRVSRFDLFIKFYQNEKKKIMKKQANKYF